MRLRFYTALFLTLFTASVQAESPSDDSQTAASEACRKLPANIIQDCLAAIKTSPDEAPAEAAAERQKVDVYRRELIEHLTASPAARDKLLAAELLNVESFMRGAAAQSAAGSDVDKPGRDRRIAALVRAAASLGKDDALVQWTIANGEFHGVAPELRAPAIVAMRRLQPDNLAVWLLAKDNGLPLDAAALRKAAATSHYDMAYFQRMAWIVDAHLAYLPGEELLADIADLPKPTPEQFARAHAVSIAMAGQLPAFTPLLSICKPEATALTAVMAEDCRRIAAILVDHADTFIALSIGLRLAEVLAVNEPEKDITRQQRRIHDWQVDQYGKLVSRQSVTEMLYAIVDGIHAPGATELGRMREQLQKAGLPLTPPPEWRSPQRE